MYLSLCLLFGLLYGSYVLFGGWLSAPTEITHGGLLATCLTYGIAKAPPLIGAFTAFFCACYGFGAAWRLRDATVTLTADMDGLKVHPSIYPKPLAWSEVSWIGITNGKESYLTFRLRARFWSVNNPLWSQSIKINMRSTSWSYRQARENIKLMHQWQREAAKAGRRP